MAQKFGFAEATLLASAIVGTTLTINTFGFDPNWIRIKTVGRTGADAVGAADSKVCFGAAANGSGQGAIGVFYDQGTTNAIGGSYFDNDAVYIDCNAAAGVTGKWAIDAWVTGGVRLICTDQIPADVDIIVEAGIATNVYCAMRLLGSASTGVKSFADIGFTPQGGIHSLAWFAGTQLGYAGTLTGFGDEDIVGIGVGVTCNGAQYAMYINADDDSPTMDTDSYCRSGECLNSIQQDGAASPDMRVAFNGWVSGGFDLNVVESPGFDTAFLVLILDGSECEYAVGDLALQTDTTTVVTENAGLVPSGIALYSHCLVQSTSDATQTGAQIAFGVATSPTNRMCMTLFDENGTPNMETSNGIRRDACLLKISTASGVESLLDIVTLPTANGFEVKNDDADSINSFVFWEAHGGGTPPGGGGDTDARLIGGDLLHSNLFGRLVA